MDEKNPIQAVHCKIFGIVQGVGFRYSVQAEARRLGLTGWVRNCSDGSVELYAEGSSVQLRHLVAWLHHGPPGAEVERVETKDVKPAGTFQRFSIAY
ncbi:MAG TPA: acylphosphatase [Treponema sp.]|nr:acylphosphatase [Treponema sp.]HPC71372.1 acylphosphatase [Treponema sp.]HRS03704.1 acylphosphatase [Treponema sp.]HRU28475.1 acylphosphatase [Treponema sp.]